MKNKEKVYLKILLVISLTLVFLNSISLVALATSSQLTDNDPSMGTEASNSGLVKDGANGPVENTTEVSVDNPTGSVATIYNDRVIWTDNRNGKNDLYMYDFSTNRETQITSSGSAANPAIYSDRIVWQDSRSGNWDLYMYNISTQKEIQVTSTGSACYPEIYGDRIVWEDNKNLNVFMFNISNSNKTSITTGGNAHNPAIYGNRIVWLDGRNGKSDVYSYDLATQKETQVSTSGKASVWNNGFDSGGLAIYGDSVVWQEVDNSGNFDICLYNLSTQKKTKITNSGSASHPAVYGEKIVWIDSNGPSSLYLYNLSSSTETMLVLGVSAESPSIYDEKIVWMNYRNGIPYLYMYDLSSGLPSEALSETNFICHFPENLPPVAAFSSSPFFGEAPLNVTFTDKTKGTPISWEWDFGDGANSTQQNPTHTYSEPGTYTVKLTASNSHGKNSKTNEVDVKKASSTGLYAYIPNSLDNNVSVIDTISNSVIATVDVGYSPWGIVVNPAGTKAYVTNSGSDNVSVIDTTSNTVTATVNVGSSPSGVAINPAGAKVYVANGGSGTISVIDTAANTVIATVNVGSSPFGVAVNPAGTKVYVSDINGHSVSVIDTATNTVIATVNVSNSPYGLVVNSEGTKVYVESNDMATGNGTVSIIDTATNTVTAVVNVGTYLYGIAITPDDKKVYVTQEYVSEDGKNTVSIIDTATSAVTAKVTVGGYPYGVAVNPDGTKVYVVNSFDNTVSVIDTAKNTVIATAIVGGSPHAPGQFIGGKNLLPIANFSTNVTTGCAPLSVQFTDLSENTMERNWNFGDGSTSAEQNPVHTYSTSGNYSVTLNASNSHGTDSKTTGIKVQTASRKTPGGFSCLIFVMIVVYLLKKQFET